MITCLQNIALAQFYPAKVYSIRDGMPTNAIYDITQSNDGVMWFMSSKGVFSYNSLDWQLFPDSLQLPNTPYSFIKSVEDGSIWVAGQNDASFVIKYYLHDSWKEIKIEELPEISNKFTFDVQIDNEGYDIVITKGNKAYIYNTKTKHLDGTTVSTLDNFSINEASFRKNKAYLSTTEGLFILDSTLTPHSVNRLLPFNNEILQIHWKKDGLLLMGIGWLGQYSSGKFTYLSTDTGITKRSYFNKHSLTIDQFDRIFYSSVSPANYFDNASSPAKTLYVNGRIYNTLSNKIYVDLENNVWVGDHRGLLKFNVLRFQNYNANTSLAEDEVTVVIQAANDEIIVANTRHLNFLHNGAVTKKLSIDRIPEARIVDLAQDESGNIYIAANTGGLLVYGGKEIKKVGWKGLPNERVVTSVELFNDQVFYTSDRAIHAIKEGENKLQIQIPGLRNLQRLNKDTLVALTTSRGIVFYNPVARDTSSIFAKNSSYNNVFAVIKWRGKYYVGTGGGLAIIKNGEITPVDLGNKLSRVEIYSLLVSRNDRLWMGTNEGVFIWDESKIINYHKSYGLVGDEVNRNAFIEDNHDKIWIGTETGVSVYSYDEDLSVHVTPKMHLGEITTQNGTLLSKTNQTLEYNDNTIEFKFLGISFFDEQQITYRYKLDGFDSEWNYTRDRTSNSARYTNLPAGEFKFVVEASMANDYWSKPAFINFSIQKPFYSNNWFVLLSIMLILSLLYVTYRIRFYVIFQNQKKLKNEVASRTLEIQVMNNEIQAQNEELRAQSEEIFTNNEKLEETVQERTLQLKQQNEKLSEYAFMNSHQLRAPICRLIGLLNLLTITTKEEHATILDLIHETGLELDQITREINDRLEDVDFTKLEELNSIETINAEKKPKENLE